VDVHKKLKLVMDCQWQTTC